MKTRQTIFLLTALAMVATLIACSGVSSTTSPPPVMLIAALSGTQQSAPVGTAFTARLVATVTTGGSPKSGVMVTFTPPTSGAGGTFAGGVNTATTDSRGVAASAVFSANTTTGGYAVTASVAGASTPANFSLTNTPAVVISATSGSGQSASVGSTFAAPLVATVTTNGSPASGAIVTFTAPASGAGGIFSNGAATETDTTDANGTATSSSFSSNMTSGSYTVTASVTGAPTPASFSLTNIPVAISVLLNPPPNSLPAGTTTTLTALVSNDPTNSGVTWTCTPLNSCGSFNPTTSTGSTATTTYTAPVAVPSGGSVTVTATAVTESTQSASATITIAAAPPIFVSLRPAPPSSLQTGATATLTAVVANDPTNSGVNWTCAPVASCGSFNPTTSTASTTYTAPAAIPSGGSVTVTATAVKSTSASASANITITLAGAITVSFNPAPPTTLKPSATATLTAVVANDPTNSGVNWTCTPVNSCGSFNPATSTGSTASTTYIAPAAIPSGGSVTVTATAVKSASASASANITITASGLADGTYVFSLAGQDQFPSTSGASCGNAANTQCGPYSVAGAFRVTNGAITGGEQDFTNVNTVGSDLINGTGSGISTTADGNLQITLKTCNAKNCSRTDTNVGVGGIETLNLTLISATRALINEFDASATASGSLDQQAGTVTAPAQGYAFFTSGLDSSFSPVSIGGVINVDGTASNGTISISGAGSVFDINDSFTPIPTQSFDASSVTTPDSFGRVTFTLNPSAASGVPQIGLAGYIVGPGRVHLVETADAFRGSFGSMGGEALGQGNNTGKFNSASISGSSFVFGTTGIDLVGAYQVAGVLTVNSDGTVSGTLNTNDLSGTGAQSPITFTGGAYTVDATGRVALTNLTSNGATLQLYLSGSGTGTVVSLDTTDELSGLAYQQTASASFSGTYGLNATGFDSINRQEFDDVGPVSANPGTGALVGTHTIDQNVMTPPATPTPGLSVSGASTAFAAGVLTGTITGLDIDSQNANTDNFSYYIVDATKVVAIETDANQLMLIYFELQQ